MKRNYTDPEIKITRFEYEALMENTTVSGMGIPDIGDDAGDDGWD